jgi:hypothetical protein
MEQNITLFTANIFTSVLVALLIVWAIVETFKDIITGIQNRKYHWEKILAMILGITVCTVYHIDIPSVLGLNTPLPYFGSVLTGLLFGQGAGAFYDMLRSIMSLLDGLQPSPNE